MKISKADLIILKELEKENKNNFLKGLKIKDFFLVKTKKLKKNTVYKKITKLEKLELLKKGAKESRENTYYLSEKGLEFLKSFTK